MKFNDAVWGLLLALLSGTILFNAQRFPKIPGQNIGPGAFPGLLAILLLCCAVILIARGLRDRQGAAWVTSGAWLKSPPQLRSFLVTVGGLVFYIMLSDTLGFIPSGIIVLAAMMASLNVPRRWILPIAVVTTLVIHTIFYKGLRVPLPWGFLPVAW